MAYSPGRVGCFMEYEEGQGRHWKRKSMLRIYYSNVVTEDSRYDYPFLWLKHNYSGGLESLHYVTSRNKGYTLFLNNTWYRANIGVCARDMSAIVHSIRQFWP
ncbi:hypothetical protein [Xenorhabdus bovienii]|uniref:Uncharacterized protein n=1 Tax=Xenorhabdus bovienii str. Intermedium TaxID=1379677 RepID=A0A077QG75_XENBV|nr:hypothetical protein [Xenorhabdus bovienii]MDE9455762.1 hypothetical protein [Xenorhabdus bovienii]MDE9566120.1 hypothetical protein [Xenorhabdus bovienii]CDH31236.1 hypothetical protein XBI1_1410004 [Xenorhabdus bovienii str. Intermedium]